MRVINADAIEYFALDDVYNIDVMVAYKDRIDNMPTVDAEPVRHGKWIIGHKFSECYNVQCNQCKTIQVLYYGKKVTRYCPECGAKMDGES